MWPVFCNNTVPLSGQRTPRQNENSLEVFYTFNLLVKLQRVETSPGLVPTGQVLPPSSETALFLWTFKHVPVLW